MHAFMEDDPRPAGSLMPPATTQRRYALPTPPALGEPRIVPPFVARPSTPPAEPAAEPAPEPAAEPEAPVPTLPVAESAPAPEPVVEDRAETDEEDHRWEEVPDDEGVVEPAFEADTDAVLEALTQQATELARRDEFPLEAFIVPEQAQRVPTGFEHSDAHDQGGEKQVASLATRLEKLSHRLRVEDADSIVRRLAAGDRLDALLAGLLAGYLAGKSEQS